MRQIKVCTIRVFVPGVHASPRRLKKEKEEEEKEKKTTRRLKNFNERKTL